MDPCHRLLSGQVVQSPRPCLPACPHPLFLSPSHLSACLSLYGTKPGELVNYAVSDHVCIQGSVPRTSMEFGC